MAASPASVEGATELSPTDPGLPLLARPETQNKAVRGDVSEENSTTHSQREGQGKTVIDFLFNVA